MLNELNSPKLLDEVATGWATCVWFAILKSPKLLEEIDDCGAFENAAFAGKVFCEVESAVVVIVGLVKDAELKSPKSLD